MPRTETRSKQHELARQVEDFAEAGSRPALTRRGALVATVAVAVAPMALNGRVAHALEQQAVAAIEEITKGAVVQPGRVSIMLPELAENGNSVALTVTADSPMTAADHVKAIHIVSEKNPIARVVSFTLGPRSGRAQVQTNIRLATTQTVTAIAEMSDGSFWSANQEVIVTLAACLDAG